MILGSLRRIGAVAAALGFLALAAAPGSAEVRSTHLILGREDLSRARTTGVKAVPSGDSTPGFSVIEAPFSFSAVAVLTNPSSDGDLLVRVSADGREWSSAVLVPDDEPNPPLNERGRAHRFALERVSSLYFPKSAAGVSPRFLAFEFANARNPPARVTFHFIDAGAIE